jgi:predicted TIM-barrel fold metal-dependent hydrolase
MGVAAVVLSGSEGALIVDCHCHAGTGDGLTGPWNTAAPLKQFLRRARAAGIERVNLLPVFHSDYRAANRQVGALVRRSPDLFTGFAGVHAERDAGQVRALIGEAVRGWGARGIKVHRHDARITREICEVARDFGLPLLYDVVGEVAPLELVARAYRDVTFIIPHLGSFADDWRPQLALLDHMQRHPNVYGETSGVRRFDLLVRAIERAGPGKLLFGSDGPWLHPGVELAKVRALGLSPPDEALVLGGNFLRLTGQRAASARPARAARR